jgi:glutamate-ammonia-ligase adenylyltransferase
MTDQFVAKLDSLPESLKAGLADWWSTFTLKSSCSDEVQTMLPQVLASSDFVHRYLATSDEKVQALFDSGILTTRYPHGHFTNLLAELFVPDATQDELMRGLRLLRIRETVRIAFRDLAAWADLDETLADTSDLAEACIRQVVDWAHTQLVEKHGEPRSKEGVAQRLVVLGMGKLGGRELNFSSDIDLIFTYPQSGMTDGARALDNQQFFIRLGQLVIKMLNEVTVDGFVYRVDMRLRPFGDSGPLASNFDSLEHYYLTHGREWERYALIKARVVGGDDEAASELSDTLRPFVFRRYLDYGAIEELRDMKAMIDRQARAKGQLDNVKLGPGGIREIEFIGQSFQLVRGGRDADLQARGIREVLATIADRELISSANVYRLLKAYAFLRRTENHIQMFADQQAHSLPDDAHAQLRLAFSMGFKDWDAFRAELDRHRAAVNEQFSQVFSVEDESEADETETNAHIRIWSESLEDGVSVQLFAELGFDDYESAAKLIEDLKQSRAIRVMSEKGRKRLDRLMPRLLLEISGYDERQDLLQRFCQFVQVIAGRSVYISLLAEHEHVLGQLVKLFAASGWIVDQVTRHPILLDELMDPRSLYHPPNREQMDATLVRDLESVDTDDIEMVMDKLRHFKQSQVFRVAAADIMDALPIMKVSDHLSWIAEIILAHAIDRVWAYMTQRHGQPTCEVEGETHYPRLGVIAYGKLGGLELGYSSDLDIVFVHDSRGSKQFTDGDRSLENSVFFARLVQRLITMLTAFTAAGELYEVDMRLRPSGNSGLLVTSLAALEKYQVDEAWTWEHQSLIRARAVVGDDHICQEFAAIRDRVLQQSRDNDELRKEVSEMREKMWQEKAGKKPGRFDLKKDPGGITDIEFMVQYSVLANAHKSPLLTKYTDNIRILNMLIEAEVIDFEKGSFLIETYRTFRDELHALSLMGKDSDVGREYYTDECDGVQQLWREIMQGEPMRVE